MSSPAQTPVSSSQFNQILEASLRKYQKKTGKNILSHPLAVELQRCDSVDAILAILQGQAEAFEQFRGGDRRLMKGIRISVDVLSALSNTLGEGVNLVFPPAKTIFCGIGILLAAAKDVTASHNVLVELFGRIEGFFKRLKIYTQTSSTTDFADVLVNVVVEVLNVLSIATKEMEQSRAKTYIKKLLGRADIEDALKRLDNLIREEHQAATAEVLLVTSELRDGSNRTNTTMQQIVNDVDDVKWNQIQQDVRKWYSASDPSTNYNIGCKTYHKGTTTWFFEGSLFKNWESTASLLWLHGKPGSGKSILCSAIIKRIMTLRDAGRAHLAYFYFDFRDEYKQNVRNLLTSLLIQLSAYSSPCRNIISRLYSKHGNGTQQASDDALTNCLKEALMAAAAEHPTYIIMDALDECPDISGMPTPREVVLDFVEDLVCLHLPNVHICVTSRPEINIKAVLEPLATHAASIHDETGQKEDIANYVCSVVYSDRKMRGWRDEDKKLVVEVLSERADGMFRWVFCQLETLRHSFPRNMRLILEELPKSLDETYERLLKGISENNREYACRLLHCLTVAIRPLTVEELAEILAFDLDMGQGSIPKFHADWRWKDQEYAVLSTCSSLISIVDNNGSRVVQFSHFSVKEFLTSNRLATSTSVSRYHILPVPAHTVLARVCLGFLLHLDNHIDDKGMKGFPLAKYASQHWVAHAQFKGVASRVKDGMQSLFDPDRPHFAAWVQIHDMDSPVFRVSLTKRPNRPNPLYYSALCGFQDVVENLVITHPTLINAISGRYESPLLVALRCKHIRIAEFLLENGGNVDVRGKRGQTPLHNVVLWSHNSVVDAVRFLLKHGADVNAQRSGDLCTSLHLAANNGELRVTQLLLDHSADVNPRNNKGQTPLHLVSRLEMSLNECNRPGVVRLLIAHGADVNARDMTHATPLLYASCRGRLEVAQVLLDHGAKVNDQGATQSPLHLLLESDHNPHDVLILVELLLKYGVDVNLQDENNLTPLHLALRKKWLDIARKLLEHGANPNAKDDQGQITLHLLSKSTYDAYASRLDLMELLLKCGANVNAQDENNTTPLHLASIQGWSTARKLLDHGANPNAQDNQGQTPLQLLLKHGDHLNNCLDITLLLLSEGADVNIQDRNNVTALHLASIRWVRQVAQVLLEHGARVNMKNDRGQTPLHLLLNSNMSQDGFGYTQLFLEHGADANARDMNNITPLHLASQSELVEVARILLDHGANPNAINVQGQTPLHLFLATWQAYNVDLVELLLKCGANATAQDTNNITPLQLALRGGETEMARILRNHRAEVNSGDNMGPGATPSLLASQGGNELEETPQPTDPSGSQRWHNRFRLPSFGFRRGDRG